MVCSVVTTWPLIPSEMVRWCCMKGVVGSFEITLPSEYSGGVVCSLRVQYSGPSEYPHVVDRGVVCVFGMTQPISSDIQ